MALGRIVKVLTVIGFLLLVPLIIKLFVNQELFVHLNSLLEERFVLFLILLLITKASSIVYPPLPGAIFTLGSLPLLGWEWAYTVDVIGSMLGASIAFLLGSRYGKRLITWATGDKITQKITSIKVKKDRQIEASILIRIASGGILSDGLAWGASLIGFRYKPFIIGYLISHLLTTLPLFILLSLSISVQSWAILLPIAALVWFLLYKFKGRYFE
jgi:uncharacterized membrane protein YdjX (TVP38/TMEM64 family)